jgi:multicomponent Na+:H+ antiporter subunit B
MGWFDLINLILLALLMTTALAIVRMRTLYEATMLTAVFSLLTASMFVLLAAPDVAFTEAAVGVGISTILLLGGLALTRSREAVTPRRRSLPGVVVVGLTGGTLVYASQDLPPIGVADTPVHGHPLTEVYLSESRHDIGIPNAVTSVLASYRGLDTLGELVVVFTAGVAVLLLLGSLPRSRQTEPRDLVLAEYRVLRVVSSLLMPFILLFALYVLFHGEYGAGGGFQAGVIFASAFALYGLVFGLDPLRRMLPMRVVWVLAPLGLLLYLGLGVVNILLGGSFLDYDTLSPDSPEIGQHLGILIVESAIGATVAAVMISIFAGFAGRGVTR